MSLKQEILKLTSITEYDDFSIDTDEIITDYIKSNPSTEIKMIKSFRKELNSVVENLLMNNDKVINMNNVLILPTEFSFIYSLQRTVDFAVSLIESKEDLTKVMLHQSTVPSYVSKTLKEELKSLFHTLVYAKLKELNTIKELSKTDYFRNEEEIRDFISNEYIQKSLNRIGFKVTIINSSYYANPCGIDSFPSVHTIFFTGGTTEISKEEALLIPLGIMIYNDLSNFGKNDMSNSEFSAYNSEQSADIFAQTFAYYIMDKMGIEYKHRYYENLYDFDMDMLNSDLEFVEKVLNQEPNYAFIR